MMYLNTISQDAFNALNENQTIDTKEPSSQLQLLQKNRRLLDHLFEEANKDIESNAMTLTKTPLQFEFVLNMHKSNQSFEYELYLKAGVDHLYVIHDILDVTNHLKEMNILLASSLNTPQKNIFILVSTSPYIKVGKAQKSSCFVGHSLERNGVLSMPPKNVATASTK